MLQVGEADDFVWDVDEASAADIGLDLSAVDTQWMRHHFILKL